MTERSRRPSRTATEESIDASRQRRQFAAEVASALDAAGVPAIVLLSRAQLNDFVRKQAEQILAAASRCRFPEVRAQMEEMARAALAELDRIDPGH